MVVRTTLMGLGVAMLVGCGGPAPDEATTESAAGTWREVQVRSLVDGSYIKDSKAKLREDPNFGVAEVEIESRKLPVGHVILASFVVFNDESACTVGNPVTGAPCGAGDLPNAAAGGSVQFMSGAVVGSDGKFKSATVDYPFFDTSRCYGSSPPCRQGVTNLGQVEFHLVLRDKGPLIPERFEEQSTTFFGGCDVYACKLLQAGQFLP